MHFHRFCSKLRAHARSQGADTCCTLNWCIHRQVMLFSSTLIQRISSLLLTPRFADANGFLAFMCADCAAAAEKGTVSPLSVKGGTDFGSLTRIQPPLQKLSLIEQCIVRRSRYTCLRRYLSFIFTLLQVLPIHCQLRHIR